MELYYYTTTETMRYIITKGDIYATNVGYLNDSDEYINGLREIRSLLDVAGEFGFNKLEEDAKNLVTEDAFRKIKAQASDIYSISFSRASDLLSQWHMYAKESGVQIKMIFEDSQKYKYFSQPEFKDKSATSREKKELKINDLYYLTKIGMPSDEYRETGKRVLNEFKSCFMDTKEMISAWKMLAPFIKNYGFRQEQEMRIIFLASEHGLNIGYRNDRNVLKPYLDNETVEGWPVCEIMVGPGRNQNQVFQSICHFLEHTSLKIKRLSDKELVQSYFDGMREYGLSETKIKECKEQVLQITPTIEKLGVKYSDRIHEVLTTSFKEKERNLADGYIQNNYFSDKGIIVTKSKWPYEF